MSETGKTIKVVDRRLFTPEGEIREEIRAELEAPDSPPPSSSTAKDTFSKGKPSETPGESADEIPTNRAFLRLLDMLAQTASLYLEGFPDPATGRRQVDLTATRQIIDSLDALRDKTKGRLSFEEADALEGLLGQLQMAFARLAAPPKKGPAPSVPRRG